MSCWGMMTHRGCLTMRQVSDAAVAGAGGAGGVWTHWCKRAATLARNAFVCTHAVPHCHLQQLTCAVQYTTHRIVCRLFVHTGGEWLPNTAPCMLLLLCMAGGCEGLAYATIEPPPENPMQTIPRNLRAKSRREADYLLRYISCE